MATWRGAETIVASGNTMWQRPQKGGEKRLGKAALKFIELRLQTD